MDIASPEGRHFAMAKPKLGRARGGLTLLPGRIRLEHRLVKGPIEVPLHQIRAVIGPERPDEELPLLRRDVRSLTLVADAFRHDSVVLVLESPVHLPKFKLGAENLLAITARERRRGIDVEVLEVQLADPAAAAGALAEAGVARRRSLAGVLVDQVGIPSSPVEAEVREAEVATAARRQRVRLLALALLVGGLQAVRFGLALSAPATTMLRIGAATAGFALLLIVLASRRAPGSPSAGPPLPGVVLPAPTPTRWSLSTRQIVLTAILLVVTTGGLVLMLALAPFVGPFAVLVPGAIGGLTVGALVSLIPGRAGKPGMVVGGTGRADPGVRLARPVAVVVGMAAIAGIAAVASAEPGSMRDLREVREAIVAVDDLVPSRGWGELGGLVTDQGSELDDHLCAEASAGPSFTAAVHQEFQHPILLTLPGATEWLRVGLYVAPDERSAARELEVLDAPHYEACIVALAESSVRDHGLAGTERTSTVARRSVDGLGRVDEVTVASVSVTGVTSFDVVTFVRATVGRVVVRMAAVGWGHTVPDAQLVEILERQARRIEASSL